MKVNIVDVNDISKQYGVSIATVQRLLDIGILEGVENETQAIQRLVDSICLYSIGLDVGMIKKYILLKNSNRNTSKERIEILEQARKDNLNNMHASKKTLDCIECILKEVD